MKSCLVIFAVTLVLQHGMTSACKCAPVSLETRLCQSDFSGVVEVMGDSTDNCEEQDKCRPITVLESFKTTFFPNMMSTFGSSAACGVSFDLPTSGKYLIGGYMRYGGTSVNLASCSFVLKEVSGSEDPAISEYKNLLKNCKTVNY